MIIALDMMGGDFAPEAPAQAALQALERYPDIQLQLVGPSETLRGLLEAGSLSSWVQQQRIKICEAPDRIEMDESPVEAVRHKPGSSLVKGVLQLAQGHAGAFVTAGNSGAAMVAGIRLLRTLPGIERPALAVLFPGRHSETVLLDVGFQVQCRPRHLLQFARLGTLLARHGLGIAHPRVGLINIGEEAGKGHALARESWRLLSESELNFVGNIEGWDLPRDRVDVAVCDGFTGNVMLKLAEGLSEMFMAICPPLARLPCSERFQYVEQGGSLVLGIDGLVIVTHGRAQAPALVSAIGLARRALLGRTLAQMREQLHAASAARPAEQAKSKQKEQRI